MGTFEDKVKGFAKDEKSVYDMNVCAKQELQSMLEAVIKYHEGAVTSITKQQRLEEKRQGDQKMARVRTLGTKKYNQLRVDHLGKIQTLNQVLKRFPDNWIVPGLPKERWTC